MITKSFFPSPSGEGAGGEVNGNDVNYSNYDINKLLPLYFRACPALAGRGVRGEVTGDEYQTRQV